MARILVVEDDTEVLDRVKRTLESGGHQVMQAHRPAEWEPSSVPPPQRDHGKQSDD